MSGNNGTNWVAIAGAITGGLALLWNVARALREGARLRVSFFIYRVDHPDDKRSAAAISIANTGTLPAYVSDIALTSRRPWFSRLPLIGSASFRTLNRWWLRWAVQGTNVTQWRVHSNPDLAGKLEPGEMKEGHLVDIVNGEPEPMNSAKVEKNVLREHPWALVETGLRRYWARVVDNRPTTPRTEPTT